MKLKLADNLSLPLDAVTQTFLVVGKRGSGKSNTAARFVEQLHRARLPFVVLDPVDTWWGLKASREGGKGLDVYVFGGRKQDLPLDAGGGALIAEVLCEHRLSMVLSVKHLSGRERSAFMVAFAQTLFQKWGGGPLHVVLEEAHELAPQMSGTRNSSSNTDNEAAMLSAFKRLWKLGRSSGIGGTAVTQRPASLSKDITTQSEILIAHRTIGPQDVAAIGAWVKYHGERLDILAELPTLPTGEAFVWAPEFPEGQAIGLKRTTVLLRETYDSASTPKVGEQRVEPKELAPVDLERLRTKLAATIEKAKADDPRELRKQIGERDRELARTKQALSMATGAQQALVQQKIIEKPVLKDGQLARAEKIVEQSFALVVKFQDLLGQFGETVLVNALRESTKEITAAIQQTHAPVPAPRREPLTPTNSVGRVRPVSPPGRPAREVAASNGNLTGPEQRIVDAIAWLEQLGITEPEQPAVAFLANYRYGGGAFNNPRGALRVRGYVDYLPGDRIQLTEDGRKVARYPDMILTNDELQRRVLGRLPGPEQRVLEPLLRSYPKPMTNEDLAEAANYAPGAGSFNNPKGRLRTLGLIDYPKPGYAVARDLLFPENR